MSEQLQLRRGTAAQVAAFTGAQGEVVVDTTNNRAVINDGATMGGWPAAKLAEVVTNAHTAVSDANYTALTSDRLIAFTALTAARVVTLPPAASYPTGTRLMIVDESGACSSAKTIAVNRAGSDLIDGATNFAIAGAYGGLEIESNGSNAWTILSPKPNLQASLVSVGTAPDPNNPLSVYGPSALFNGATNMNVTVNKNGASATASMIFEDGFSGRAQMGLNGSDNFSFKVSPNGSSWTTAIALDAATGAATFANQRTAVADANYAALPTDRLVAYTALTAARTVSLPPASAYPPGQHLVVVDESGACSATNTITVSRAGSDTINGVASIAIASAFGAVMLESNGANAWTIIKRAGGANVLTFSSSGTYTPTPGMTVCDVYLIGGGGGGGGGCLEATSTACSGGGGGGGASIAKGRFTAAQIGASQSVTVGAGGGVGAAATSNSTAGAGGGQGGYTSFGTLLAAFAGGGGAGGQLNAAASGGGGGGGQQAAGGNASGATGGSAGAGGSAGGSGVSASSPSINLGGSGGGGCSAAGVPTNSAYTFGGGTGGGSGGGLSSTNGVNNGGNGGNQFASGVVTVGGNGGTAPTSGGAGGNPANFSPEFMAGSGGGGGGSAISGTAGSGGAGGRGAGGGGGGSAQNGGTAGAGGAGGAGYCIVVEFF
ncbi:MAG TPA: hypothetical protein VGH40_18595 [Roseiarcus sp.]|jgi:hypothetical protein